MGWLNEDEEHTLDGVIEKLVDIDTRTGAPVLVLFMYITRYVTLQWRLRRETVGHCWT